jgi:hypothetical protein
VFPESGAVDGYLKFRIISKKVTAAQDHFSRQRSLMDRAELLSHNHGYGQIPSRGNAASLKPDADTRNNILNLPPGFGKNFKLDFMDSKLMKFCKSVSRFTMLF